MVGITVLDCTMTTIKTEYTQGSIGGVGYGSKVRVIMRSPVALMFVGYGVNIIALPFPRGINPVKIASKASREQLSRPETRAKIVKFFGEGADKASLLAFEKKGFGTVLFEGGGDKLPLPSVEQSRIDIARYELVTPTQYVVPENVERCLQCSSPMPRVLKTHHMGAEIQKDHPKTIDDCQRLTNRSVASVHGYDIRFEEQWPYISFFKTWDGESYTRTVFCNDKCASIYGRRAAAELPHLEAGGSPPDFSHEIENSQSHYDEQAAAHRQRERIEDYFDNHPSYTGPKTDHDYKK